MSDTYTKLFSSITESTVWGEPYATRIVWVTMLAMVDAQGKVYGAVPGLARRANVTLAEVEAALAAFLAPDPYSRTRDEDGRRIEAIDGGWRLINHAKYSAVRNEDERRAYKREWDKQNRPSGYKRGGQPDSSPTQSDTVRHQPEETRQPDPTNTNTNTNTNTTPEGSKRAEDSQSARSPEQPTPINPTAAGRACLAMRRGGLMQTNPSHPQLLAAIAAGATDDALWEDTAREGAGHDPPKGFAWVIATVRGRLADAANAPRGTAHAAHRQPSPRRESLTARAARINAEHDRRGH